MRGVHHLEFTIEPFVEGRPGPHVTAALAAAADLGITVEFGPFSSSCRVATDRMGAVVATITDAALAHGASHVSLHVSSLDDPEAVEPVGSEPADR